MSTMTGTMLCTKKAMLDECDPGMIQVCKVYGLDLKLGEVEEAENGYFSRLYTVTGELPKWPEYLNAVKRQSAAIGIEFNATVEVHKYVH